MMLLGGFEVPDTCPEHCAGKNTSYGQGDSCCRCPVFNCTVEEDNPYGPMLRKSEYRTDWGKIWEKWFRDGAVAPMPQLRF